MTENEMKVVAYRAAILALARVFPGLDRDEFVSAIVILAKDYDTAQYWAKKEKQEAANNELGEQQ